MRYVNLLYLNYLFLWNYKELEILNVEYTPMRVW